MLERALATTPPAVLRSSGAGFDLIAELKRRSPANGSLSAASADVAAQVTTYAQAGAAAVSILTEPSRFDGSLADLQVAAQSLASRHIPAMRKDFLVDPYQISEARAAGAGGVLLILRLLAAEQLAELLDAAHRLRLFVLLEAFDEHDIESLHAALERIPAARRGAGGQQLLAGLNCRALATLQVVPERLEALVWLLPKAVPKVAESGVVTAADARRVAACGYEYALVGSALMQAPDPRSLATSMLCAGRSAARPSSESPS